MLRFFGSVHRIALFVFCLTAVGLWTWLWRSHLLPSIPAESTHLPTNDTSNLDTTPASESQLEPLVSNLSSILFPISPKANISTSYITENHKNIQALFLCLESSNCRPNQDKVVILGDKFFHESFQGLVGGEHIWAGSMIEALRNLGYTFVFAPNLQRAVQLYETVEELVVAFIADPYAARDCFRETEYCALSDKNPYGIPVWKTFSLQFWSHADSELGPAWTLNPEDYQLGGHYPNTYIGYSIESSCQSTPFVAESERENRAYILTKYLLNFVPGPRRAWPSDFFEAASNATGIKFVAGIDGRAVPEATPEPPAGLIDLGFMSRPQFLENISKSRMLIGMGNPVVSPTPYEALCLGVPFINPIMQWDVEDPSNKNKWLTQHDILKFLDPPYVYNVFQGDRDGFVNAIQDALAHPIDSYVLERMRMAALEKRLDNFLKTDWKSKAADLLAERLATGQGEIFTI